MEAGHEEDEKEDTEGNGERDYGDTPLLLTFNKEKASVFRQGETSREASC